MYSKLTGFYSECGMKTLKCSKQGSHIILFGFVKDYSTCSLKNRYCNKVRVEARKLVRRQLPGVGAQDWGLGLRCER